MIKKVLVFIIVFIIFYEIYLLYINKSTTKNNKSNEIYIEKQNNNEIIPIENKSFSYIDNNVNVNNDYYNNNIINDDINNISTRSTNYNNIINSSNYNNTINSSNYNEINNKIDAYSNNKSDYSNTDYDEITNVIVNNVDPQMFGKPSKFEKNNIIVWDILEPKPWNKIIYKYNEKYPFYFHIKIKIPSLNDYNNWKNIISNLDFDPKSGELIIPTEDEETALSIVNLIISNFKGDLTIEEILNKNLIDISINKAKKYDVVKNKLKEQIIINLNDKPTELFNSINTQTFTTDLAKTQNKYDEYNAYEGIEYSFF